MLSKGLRKLGLTTEEARPVHSRAVRGVGVGGAQWARGIVVDEDRHPGVGVGTFLTVSGRKE